MIFIHRAAHLHHKGHWFLSPSGFTYVVCIECGQALYIPQQDISNYVVHKPIVCTHEKCGWQSETAAMIVE